MALSIRRFMALALSASLLTTPIACASKGGGRDSKSSTTVRNSVSRAGFGRARITIGDETWAFEGVTCGFGEKGTGVSGGIFNASATAKGFALYVANDGGNDSYIKLNDDNDPEFGENWTTQDGEPLPVINVDGKKVTAKAVFTSTNEAPTPAKAGSVEITCS